MVDSILRGEDVGITPRRRACNSKTPSSQTGSLSTVSTIIKKPAKLQVVCRYYLCGVVSSPVVSLCHTHGVVRRPSSVVCVHHNYQK